MTRRYTYATTLNWGGDTPTAEVEVEVSYVVTWGRAETPPAYGHGGLPADPDEIDDIRLEKVEGKPRPWGMYLGYVANEDDAFATECVEKIEGSEHHLAEMLREAREYEAADAEAAADARYERQREDARGDR